MNKIDLLKRLLPGFLPIVVYVIADEVFGMFWGLVVALLVALLELGIGYFRTKEIDRFVLFDVGLLILLGGVSMGLENDFFFKLKPGIMSIIMTGFIGFSVFSNHNVLLLMANRYMKGMAINPFQLWQMKQSMVKMFLLMLLYSFMALGSAFLESKAVWAFISGPGLFVVFGIFFLWDWFLKKRQAIVYQQDEWLPLVNEVGLVVGSAPRSVVHHQSMLLHPVVHLHVLFNQGVWLQKRPSHKLIQPNKWDTTVGGHVDMGESIEKAMQRETLEEIGLVNFQAKNLAPYVWKSKVEHELVFVFITHQAGPFHCRTNEVDEIRWWSFADVDSKLGQGVFTPNFEHEYLNILKPQFVS